MEFEFDIEHSADSIRGTYREWWRARYGGAYRAALGACALGACAFFFMLILLYRSSHWALLTGVGITAGYAALLQTLRDQTVATVLKAIDVVGLRFRYHANDQRLRETGASTGAELRWDTFARVVRQPAHLLLVRKPEEAQSFVAMPLAQLPEGFEAFVNARIPGR
jgi:hypothetical protein